MTIEGNVVIVTGAGSGIGQALASGFVGDGAHVVGFERNALGSARHSGCATAGCSRWSGT